MNSRLCLLLELGAAPARAVDSEPVAPSGAAQRADEAACEEYADLKTPVDRHKATGNRFVAAP